MDKKLIIALLVVTILQMGCSSSRTQPPELSVVQALKPTANFKIGSIRFESLKQTARGLGAQAGLAWRSRELNVMLNKNKRNLDRVFNFNYLMLNHNVLPPVLVEGRNTLNLADDYTVRISDHDYQIVQQPSFTTVPPNWRHYLWMAYQRPEIPNITLLPKSAEERTIWNAYVKIGWNEGIIQADDIFMANLNRLQRDYNGMILYRKLLAQNMLTPPYVTQSELGVTGGGNDMRINDRVLRITTIPQLKTDYKSWRPIVSEQITTNKNLVSIPSFKKGKV